MTSNYWKSAIFTIVLGGQLLGVDAIQATASQKRTACQIKNELACTLVSFPIFDR
ncbi:hypothetical protein [Coleofasciculus chthonoplastes]|uniref:hypothetical protein n=1 Tax=Coleofasciculus chthonoplastes TaxID=64178 RepID=UPI0032F628B1